MTDIFSFILVMVSLVLAIGVTQLVHGVASLIRLRGSMRPEPLPLVWAASLFLVAAIYWWSLWDFRSVDWRFHHFFYLLLAPTLLHVAASLLVSTDAVAAGANTRSEFDRIRVPFMVVMAAFSIVVAFDAWILGVESFWTNFRPIQLWTVALYVAGATLAGVRAQRIVAGLVLVTYLAAGFFFRYVPGAFGS
ncbi:MAG: hypothetical protein V9E93_11830 [Steroidobacteraceae bacterium]|mgnify:FL=1|nr:hypothetical protein [Steroidobacteraceae bacterium]MBP7012767.1 hypothetical protein [Steroidobacteraceae bacterium]